MRKCLFNILFLLLLMLSLANISIYGEEIQISSDSALSIALEYLNGDPTGGKNMRDNVRIRSINLNNSLSPYFRKFFNDKDAWEITFFKNNPILLVPNNRDKQLELKVYIDRKTRLLLKITCLIDSKSCFSMAESEKIENGILSGRFHYSGISKNIPIPFMDLFPKIPADIYNASVIEAFAMEYEAKDGTTKSFWHVVLYDFATSVSIPPVPDNGSKRHQTNSGAVKVKVRKDVIFDGATGKIISDMELK